MDNDQFLNVSQQLIVRPASSQADMDWIARARYLGYGCFESLAASLDELDFAANCLLLVAELPQRGIVGTLRLLGGDGEVELDRFIDVDNIAPIQERSFGEATRLVIPRCREILVIKTLLCKASWLYCQAQKWDYLLVSAKQRIAEFYQFMQMKDLGTAGVYTHATLNNTEHRTYMLHVESVSHNYEQTRHAYADFMTSVRHNIHFS